MSAINGIPSAKEEILDNNLIPLKEDKMHILEENREEVHFASGSKYIGSIKNGKLSGYGTYYYFPSRDIYEGEWEDDMKHGHGTYTYAGGDYYVGEWYMGKKHNRGTYSFSNGDKYVGFWKNDKIHGYGVFTIQSNNNRYEGFWQEAYRHGHGVFYYGNGDVYDGNWVIGKEEGFGIFIQTIGLIYCGEWKEGEMNGKGILRDQGILYAVEYINSYAVSRIPIPAVGKPATEWLKAYEFYMNYMGKQQQYGDQIARERDELRNALEKLKIESALWRKHYEDLLTEGSENKVVIPEDSTTEMEYQKLTRELSKPSDSKENSLMKHLFSENPDFQIDEIEASLLKLSHEAPNIKRSDHKRKKSFTNNKDIYNGDIKSKEESNMEGVTKESLKIETMRNEIVALRQHNTELMRKNKEIETQKAVIISEKDSMTQKLNLFSTKLYELEKRYNDAISLEEKASRDAMMFRERVKDLENAKEEKGHLYNTKKDSLQIQHSVNNVDQKFKEVNEANAELQLRCNNLEKEVKHHRERYETLLDQTHQYSDTKLLDNPRKEVQKLTVMLNNAEENLRTVKVELDYRKSRCMELESSLLTMARQKTTDPNILLSLDRKIDHLRTLQESNAELSRLLEETRSELSILKKGNKVARERRRSVELSEANLEEVLKEVREELKKEQKKYKKASDHRESLAVELYEEQVKHARAERTLQSLQGCYTVIVRIQGSKESSLNPCIIVNEMDYSQVILSEDNEKQTFQFDVCFDENASWESIFNEVRRTMIAITMGFQVAYVTLGAFRTGKTVMFNSFISLVTKYMIDICHQFISDKYEVRYQLGGLEINSSGVIDLETGSTITEVQHDAYGYSIPTDMTFLEVIDVDIFPTIERLRMRQQRNRRSHIYIQIKCIIIHKVHQTFTVGRVTLVDLCGPGPLFTQESDVESARFANRSFGHLMTVLGALQEQQEVIPYTDSFETTLLSDILGGNSLTTILGALSNSEEDVSVSRQTLRALTMASNAVNKPLLPYFVSSDEIRWKEMIAATESEEMALPRLVSVNRLRDS